MSLKFTLAVLKYYLLTFHCFHSLCMCSYSSFSHVCSSEEGVEEVSSEPSLAEMFEQIRNCRYIRHYHPDGTALEEYY